MTPQCRATCPTHVAETLLGGVARVPTRVTGERDRWRSPCRRDGREGQVEESLHNLVDAERHPKQKRAAREAFGEVLGPVGRHCSPQPSRPGAYLTRTCLYIVR